MRAGRDIVSRREPRRASSIQLEGSGKQALETGRNRLLTVAAMFALLFVVIAGRLVDLTLATADEGARAHLAGPPPVTTRADIVDRNGVLLATNLRTASLYANPRQIMDVDGAIGALRSVLPELAAAELRRKLTTARSFIWLKRGLTPKQQYAVNQLGIPGLAFRGETRRIYPHGRLAAHVLGYTGIDDEGLAGIEKFLDDTMRSRRQQGLGPLQLSLDVRAQYVLTEELRSAVDEFRAKGGAGLVLDVHSGEVLALVSLPDFDPNRIADSLPDERFSRATLGIYEMGSTFKAFTTAMALDAGVVDLASSYDATDPIRVARYVIRDYHPERRWLTVPEIFVYSSNIGAARMALDIGPERQQAFLRRLGLLDRASIELPEVGNPLTPSPWREINTMTIAYGHGIAVSPLQLAGGIAALVNGGMRIPTTLLRRDREEPREGERVVSAATSDVMRGLFRAVVERGTGRNADAPGFLVGGKTGTAEKSGIGGYRARALVSSFVGAFPMNEPRYLVLVLLDEPQGTKASFGFATAGWTAAPVASRIVSRIGPMLHVKPVTARATAGHGQRLTSQTDRGDGRAAF